jgi:glutamine synthetase
VTGSGSERARELIEKHGIHTVECLFADIWGTPRGKRLPAKHFLKSPEKGFAIADVCHVWDLHSFIIDVPFRPFDSGWPDMAVIPDLETFGLAPWLEGTAFVVCDTVDERTHEPLVVDSRHQLRRAVERVRAAGYEPIVASEIEFHLCNDDWTPFYTGVHCYSLTKGAEVEPVVGDIRRKLEAFGIDVEACNVEYGPAQVEVNLAYGPALQVADNTVIFKYVVKEVTRQHGLRATFMAKPYREEAGNGLHVHQSLRDPSTGGNAFAVDDLGDGAPPISSSLMRRWLTGLLAHQIELTAVNCPTINSYKRVEDYSFAPTCATWGGDNRTVAVRSIAGLGEATRLESRGAAADANPYLVIAGLLHAGTDGLGRELPLPPYTPGDAYCDTTSPRIPATLQDALVAFEQSAFYREAFGDLFVDSFVALGRHEVDLFARQVTEWERARYREVV